MLTKGAPSASDRGLVGVVDRNDSMFIEGARYECDQSAGRRTNSLDKRASRQRLIS
jgi:hypothetical protein